MILRSRNLLRQLTLCLCCAGAPAVRADTDLKNTELKNTELADAVEAQDEARTISLLEQGADAVDVNAPQIDGMTAVHWAAYLDNQGIVKRLLAAGADATAKNRYGVTPLALACVNGNGRMVESLLEAGADPNAFLKGGETVLMTAARTGKPGPVKALVARGADVNAKESRGQTALMWAAAEGHTDVVDLLLSSNADLDVQLRSGFTAMFFAVREGRIRVVQRLLEAGIDVNAAMQPRGRSNGGGGRTPRKGTTALLLAVENGHFELASKLLDAGANPNDQRSGFTPLHVLTWVRKPNRGDGLDGNPAPIGSGDMNSLQLVRELVTHGADVNTRLARGKSRRGRISRKGATAFFMAAITADTALMRILVELGADPSIPNADDCTALMATAGVGAVSPGEDAGTPPEVLEAVQLALELGGDLNAVDKNGETVMHGAAYKSVPDVVEFLAKKGARIDVWNRKNKWGWTPLTIAEGYRVGNFKPSPETIAAFHRVMIAAGVKPPKRRIGLPKGEYRD